MINESMTYEESVRWLRAQPGQEQLILDCYLDEDNEVAARRFAAGEEFAQVAQWLGLENGAPKTVLDVGCGNGMASYAMARLGHQVTALDPDDSADVGLQAAARLVALIEPPGEICCVLGVVEDLPFPDASFDAVYTRQAVHHFGDLARGLAQCRRVLKPGGVFAATREHIVDDDAQLQQFLAAHALHHKHGGENAHPLPTYLAALSAAGFSSIASLGPFDTVVNHFPTSDAAMQHQIAALLGDKLKLPAANQLVKLPGAEKALRRLLSARNEAPGRLFSFVCRA